MKVNIKCIPATRRHHPSYPGVEKQRGWFSSSMDLTVKAIQNRPIPCGGLRGKRFPSKYLGIYQEKWWLFHGYVSFTRGLEFQAVLWLKFGWRGCLGCRSDSKLTKIGLESPTTKSTYFQEVPSNSGIFMKMSLFWSFWSWPFSNANLKDSM